MAESNVNEKLNWGDFEQNGEERAEYGSKLLDDLARELKIKGLVSVELSRCRQFYNCYPQILGSLTQEFRKETIRIFSDYFKVS